ncbi:MAG: XRE family transcriptional regulator, partial [Clostridia bacterium]|nr:XRE family transcriptional regulator [Clostridia bacterium]
LGKSNMMLTTFVRIAEALQVSADLLLRPDVPGTKHLYESELSDIFSGCTPGQMDSILKIVRELKQTMTPKEEY